MKSKIMKAIQIEKYGTSEELKLIEIERPVLQKREVMVKIQDAGVNPIDWKIREGYRPLRLPLVMGQDFAGEVTELGAGARRFEVGDRVVGIADHGAYAEYAAVHEDKLVLIDASISNDIAASLPTPALTAYQLIMEACRVESGQTILIHGASGAVGSIALQLAVWKGAKVIANASLADADYLYKLGASEVLDYKRDRFEDRLSHVDAVIDPVGGETAKRSVGVLKENGVLASTVGAAQKNAIRGIHAVDLVMRNDAAQLELILELVRTHLIEVRLAQSFNLDQARQAQELSQHGHVNGKIVLHVQ
jgi:NADPH:quinone reductase-like Zn-dependent oxidoreductase